MISPLDGRECVLSEELEILQGAVAAVVYQNYDNGYAVLRMNCGGSHVTVVGTIPMPVIGERLMVTGKWSSHSNFGKQFEAEFWSGCCPRPRWRSRAISAAGTSRASAR